MHELTGFQRDLLFVVAGLDGPNGQTVKKELEKYYDQDIRHGRLYPNLDTLVEKGLIEKGQQDRRTNEYILKERGRNELRSYLDWEMQVLPEEIATDTGRAIAAQNS
jgi:PadR family transcriptional regulator PadR